MRLRRLIDRFRKLTPIYDLSEIPEFESEFEEHEFWSTHSLSEELWAKLPPAPPLVPKR
jgi:hypothetical protein